MAQTFPWREGFQNLVLSTLVKNGREFVGLAPHLKATYFVGDQATLVGRCLLDYFEAQSRFPSWTVLRELVSRSAASVPGTDPETLLAFVDDLKAEDTGDWLFVRDNLGKFIKERAIMSAISKSLDLMKQDKIPEGGLAPFFDEAARAADTIDDIGFVFHMDYDYVIDKVSSVEYGTRTGFPVLDQIWPRGWGPGWLIVPLAPPKRFKTGLCINLALNIIAPTGDGDVLYYACEISQELAMCRAMYRIANLTEMDMFENIERFRATLKQRIAESVASTLVFKSFPAKSVSILDIRRHAKMVVAQYNIKPRAIIIDYAETITGTTDGGDSDFRRSASVYTGARALGAEFKCPIIMPDRCNRETTDKAVPNMTSFQGSFEKAGIVDVALGLCATDLEHRGNIIRIFNFLNRHGKALQHFRGKVSPETWKMEFNEPVTEEEEQTMVENSQPGRRGGGRGRGSNVPSELSDI